MPFNLANVFAEPLDIYLAPRASSGTANALPTLANVNSGSLPSPWITLGAQKEGSPKVTAKPVEVTIIDGTSKQLVLDWEVVVDGIEFTSANLSAVDNVLTGYSGYFDLLLVVKGTSKYYLLSGVGMTSGVTFGNRKEPHTITLTFKRGDKAKITDVLTTGNLT